MLITAFIVNQNISGLTSSTYVSKNIFATTIDIQVAFSLELMEIIHALQAGFMVRGIPTACSMLLSLSWSSKDRDRGRKGSHEE